MIYLDNKKTVELLCLQGSKEVVCALNTLHSKFAFILEENIGSDISTAIAFGLV